MSGTNRGLAGTGDPCRETEAQRFAPMNIPLDLAYLQYIQYFFSNNNPVKLANHLTNVAQRV